MTSSSILPVLLRHFHSYILVQIENNYGSIVNAEISPSKRWIAILTSKKQVALLYLSNIEEDNEKDAIKEEFILEKFILKDVSNFIWLKMKKNEGKEEENFIDSLVCIKQSKGLVIYNFSNEFHQSVAKDPNGTSHELVDIHLQRNPFLHFTFDTILNIDNSTIPFIFLSLSEILSLISELKLSNAENDFERLFDFSEEIKIESVDQKYLLLSTLHFPSFLLLRIYDDAIYIIKHFAQSLSSPSSLLFPQSSSPSSSFLISPFSSFHRMVFFTSKRQFLFILSIFRTEDRSSSFPIVEIWNIQDGNKKSYIDLLQYFTSINTSSSTKDSSLSSSSSDNNNAFVENIQSQEFVSISVSDDLSSITLQTSKSVIYLIDLNEYFQIFPETIFSSQNNNHHHHHGIDHANYYFSSNIQLFNFEREIFKIRQTHHHHHNNNITMNNNSIDDTNLKQLTNYKSSEYFERSNQMKYTLRYSFNKSGVIHKSKQNEVTNHNYTNPQSNTWYENQSKFVESTLSFTPLQLTNTNMKVSWSSTPSPQKITGFNYRANKLLQNKKENNEIVMITNGGDDQKKEMIDRKQVIQNFKVFPPFTMSLDNEKKVKQLQRVDVTPLCIIAHYLTSSSSSSSNDNNLNNEVEKIICFYDRKNWNNHAIYQLEKHSVALDYNNHSLYIYDDAKGLVVLLFNQSQTQLLHNLVMFGNAKSADCLCAINNWDQSALRLHTLHLGIQYRQISVIETAIQGIAANQYWKATNMILCYLKDNRPETFDEFYLTLAKLSMKFVGKVLQEKIQLVLSKDSSSFSQSNSCFYNKNVAWKSNLQSSSASTTDHHSLSLSFLSTQYETEEEAVVYYSQVLSILRSFQVTAPTAKKSLNALQTIENIPFNTDHHSNVNPFFVSYDENHCLSIEEKTWNDLNSIEVIKEALLYGHLSKAFSYLLRKHLHIKSFIQFLSFEKPIFTFNDFKERAYALIYQSLIKEEFNDVETIVERLGESVYDVLFEVMIHTSRRSLRNSIFKVLLKVRRSENSKFPSLQSSEVTSLIQYWKKIEKAYPNRSYALEYSKKFPNKQQQQQQQQRQQQETKKQSSFFTSSFFKSSEPRKLTPPKSDELEHTKENQSINELDDILKSSESLLGFHIIQNSIENDHPSITVFNNDEDDKKEGEEDRVLSSKNSPLLRYKIKIPANADLKSLNNDSKSGYAHFTLAWLLQWSNDTKERVLVDKEYRLNKRSLGSLLQHFISRYNWRRIGSWVLKLPIQYKEYNEFFDIHDDQQNNDCNNNNVIQNDAALYFDFLSKFHDITEQSVSSDLWNSIIQSLAVATPFMKDLILTNIARRGIFVEIHPQFWNLSKYHLNHLSHDNIRSDYLEKQMNSKKWAAILSRLGKIGNLFFNSSNNNNNNMNNNIPNSRVEDIPENYYALSKMLPVGEITFFHRELIYALLQLNVPNVIQSFLDYYRLDIHSSDPKSFLPPYVNDHDIPAWFSLLIQIRRGEDLYNASLINASICLSQNNQTPKNQPLNNMNNMNNNNNINNQKSGILAEMLKSGRLLMLLGTLVYSNNTMENTMKEMEGLNELQALRDAVKKTFPALYPVLNSSSSSIVKNNNNILIHNTQNNSDKILREMLSLLEKSSPFIIERIPELSFSNSELTKHSYHDSIDVSYYLSKCQPVKAFQLFLSQPNGLTKEQLPIVVWNILYKNVLNKSVISSGLAFLDLCEIDNTPFLINIKVIQRIISSFQSLNNLQSNNSNNNITLNTQNQQQQQMKYLDAFYSLVLSQLKVTPQLNRKLSNSNNNINSNETLALLNHILQLLIESTHNLPPTWFKENEQGVFTSSSSSSSSSSPTTSVDWEDGYISKWHLVVLFCRIYSIEVYTNHLKDLASQNEWIQFLYEAQIQQFKAEQIFELLSFFSDQQLREHLTVVVGNLSTQPHILQKRKSSSHLLTDHHHHHQYKEENIFDILLSVEKDPRGAINMLLLKCCLQKRGLLSVIASHYKNDITEDCLLSWIYAESNQYLSDALSKQILSFIQHNYYSADIFESSSSSSSSSSSISIMNSAGGGLIHDNLESKIGYHHYLNEDDDDNDVIGNEKIMNSRNNLELLFDCITELCSTRQLISIIEAFTIFDPQNPFLLYLNFHRSFLQSKFLDADRYFIEFIYVLSPELVSQLSPFTLPKIKQITSNISLDQYRINVGDKQWLKKLSISLLYDLQKKSPSDYELNRLLSLLYKLQFSDHFVNQYIIFQLLQKTKIDATISTPPSDIVSILIDKGMYKQARDYCIDAKLPKVEHDRVILNECRTLLEQYEKGGLWQKFSERLNFWKKAQSMLINYNCSPSIAGEFFNVLADRYHSSSQEYITLLNYSLEWFKQIPVNDRPSHITQQMLNDLDTRITILSAAGDGVDYKLPDRAWSFDDVDSELLDRIIGSLLNREKLQKAEDIAKQFNYNNIDLILVHSALQFAENKYQSIDDFPPEVKKILIENEHQNNNNDEENHHKQQRGKDEIFQRIISICRAGKIYAKKIYARWRIANALNLTYSVMDSKDPFQTLTFLIYRGFELIEEARLFIDLYNLDVKRVSQLLADTFFKSIFYSFDKPSSSSSSLHADEQQKLNFIIRTINPNQSSSEFANFVSLSKDPRYVGDRFIELLKSAGKSPNSETESDNETWNEREFQVLISAPLSDETQVELLIRSYHCYVLADYAEGVEHVLQLVLTHMVPSLNKKGDVLSFKLLVRLLLGIKNYLELQEIFNIIMENGYFELLLKKDNNIDESERMELQQALQRYLRNKLPRDTRKFEMMFLSFGMWREMADNYYDNAMIIIKEIGVFDVKSFAQVSKKLGSAMRLMLDASDNYVKEKCFRLSKKCLHLAALIGLQLQTPSVCLMNLGASESKRIFEMLAYFEDALIFADAYNYNSYEHWLLSLYRQVIQLQNFHYFEKYLECMPTSSSQLWLDIARMYKNDRQISAAMTNAFKYFLSQLDDEFLKSKIAAEFNFKEFPLPKSIPAELFHHYSISQQNLSL